VDISLDVKRYNHTPFEVDPGVTLLDDLRERLRSTGPKKGLRRGQCGECTVNVGGRPVLSCLTLAATVRRRWKKGEALSKGMSCTGTAGVHRTATR